MVAGCQRNALKPPTLYARGSSFSCLRPIFLREVEHNQPHLALKLLNPENLGSSLLNYAEALHMQPISVSNMRKSRYLYLLKGEQFQMYRNQSL